MQRRRTLFDTRDDAVFINGRYSPAVGREDRRIDEAPVFRRAEDLGLYRLSDLDFIGVLIGRDPEQPGIRDQRQCDFLFEPARGDRRFAVGKRVQGPVRIDAYDAFVARLVVKERELPFLHGTDFPVILRKHRLNAVFVFGADEQGLRSCAVLPEDPLRQCRQDLTRARHKEEESSDAKRRKKDQSSRGDQDLYFFLPKPGDQPDHPQTVLHALPFRLKTTIDYSILPQGKEQYKRGMLKGRQKSAKKAVIIDGGKQHVLN